MINLKGRTISVKRSVSVLCLILTFLSLSYSISYAEKNFLWRVQSKRNTVYVLGSIHLLKKDIYPLSRTIEGAFEKSDFLAVEANVNDISRLDIGKLMESAFYPGSDSLEKHVSGKTFNLIKEETARAGLPMEMVYNQKPWFLALTLESMELMICFRESPLSLGSWLIGLKTFVAITTSSRRAKSFSAVPRISSLDPKE